MHLRSHVLLFLCPLLFTGCPSGPSSDARDPIIAIPEEDRKDPHSFSRPDEVRMSHLQLDLRVDFERQVLKGEAILTLEPHQASALILDTRDLDIREVWLGEARTPGTYSMGKAQPYLGAPLTIPIHPDIRQVAIRYRTRPEAAALQWLSPAQAGQDRPFLYTQSQAILARSWIPCQDSPAVRFTYQARIAVPAGMLAVMSALNPTSPSPDGQYIFSQSRPIPAYLMALAVGDLAYRPYDGLAGVYAQPGQLLSAAWEFADTERMMQAAESLFGPYPWGRYDLLVLPPSFPFGGMENPELTFVTPSILAGDRSLTTLIAHELAHSWSGNLVTNATWNDFWLNEGFTVYLERRIMEALYGADISDMLAELGRQTLVQLLDSKGWDHPDTRLKGQLQGRNPDDGLTRIAYEKGYLFLRTAEHIYGREMLDQLLRDWFGRHAFQSVTTEDFLRHLRTHLPDQGERLSLDTWVYGTGLPAEHAPVEARLFDQVNTALSRYAQSQRAEELDTLGWKAQMWMHFLRHLPPDADLEALDRQFDFSASDNAEYLAIWLEQNLRRGRGKQVMPELERFLKRQGRRKFLTPLYKEMIHQGLTADAQRIYQQARPGYHSVARETLDALFATAGR